MQALNRRVTLRSQMGADGKPMRKKDRPGTFRRCDLDLFQTFEKLIPRKHRAAYQAHPSYKAALEQGLVPLEEPSPEEDGGGSPRPQLPVKGGAAALSKSLRRKEAEVLEAEQELEGAKL